MWDVIEHLPNPIELVSLIHKHLKDDGILIINFPNYDSLARRLLGRRWPMFLAVHLIYFTTETMMNLLAKCGFDVISVKPFFQTLELGYLLKRGSAKFGIFDLAGRFRLGTRLGRLPITYNLGQSLLVARKKVG